MAEPPVVAEFAQDFDALPEAARALFGGDAFSTLAWYRSVAQAALPEGSRAGALILRRGQDVLGVVPVRRDAGGLSALTTPYTVLWAPLLGNGLAAHEIAAMGLACGRLWRRRALARLDAVDGSAAWVAPFLAGVRRAGLVPLRFDHFGNWHAGVAGLGWEAYLAARPGSLRGTFARRARRFQAPGAFTVVDSPGGLEEALAAYGQVYEASWKQAEPFPAFNATLMRAAARDGSLRLGVLRLDGVPVAAQFWLVHGGWAGVQKLAHDERYRALAPGTVLTGLMLRHLFQHDPVSEVDFGRGDDPYKCQWVGSRRQRIGVLLAAPWRVRGFYAIAGHAAGRWRRGVTARSAPPVA